MKIPDEINKEFENFELKRLQELHRETEINFRIQSLWDGPFEFYFDVGIDKKGDSFFKKSAFFENLNDGISWLIVQYSKKMINKRTK